MGTGEARPPSAFDRALRLLAQRPHFRDELRRKLLRRAYELAEIDEALDRLLELGYLDDRRLAAEEADRLRQRKGLARAGVAGKLAAKGADRTVIDEVLGGDDPREVERAEAFGRRWLARGGRDGAGLARFLARKGYPARVILRVLSDLVPEAEVELGGE